MEKRRSIGPHLLKRRLRKTPQPAAVQLADAGVAQALDRARADAQVLVYPLAKESVGHARQLQGRHPSPSGAGITSCCLHPRRARVPRRALTMLQP
jgi:hypothetical protein